ncbi:hypothetical protein HII31_10015 [Pseudocercospora fuligena]|uniref:Uncharacterized protein n=1 Tax=Pseudocercospora fuligena TaxID=685502 RepID=A0A8H6VDI8_9PEZI|nr:hypothetical protein HII31_10015 [Pseudocercospora fuligena]
MTLGSQVLDQSVPIAYAKFNSTPYWQGSGAQTPLSIARYLAGASILSSIASKNGSTDLWGNVKIPYIEAYETAPEQRPDEGDWYNTSASYDTFSSLVGVPTLGVENTNSTYTFNLEANYLYLGCRWNSSDSNYFASNSFNSSGPGNDDRGEVQDQNALSIRTFVFNSKLGETICNISTTYVEVVVSCNDQAIANNGSEVPSSGCTASRVRRSRLDNPQPYYTTLDSQGQDSFSLIAQLSRIFNSEDSLPTPFDNYLLSPEDVMGLRTGFEQGTSNHGNVTDRTLSNRLGQLMNTWWTILSGLSVVSGGLSSDTARIEGLPTPSPGLLGTAFTTNTTATRTAVVEVIQSHDGWVIALCFASGLLIIASLIRPFMRHFLIRGPDILLNFSSLVARNNEYIPLASSGSFMVASERARLLKNLRVRFGDVESSADVGKLVIGGLGMVGTKAPKYLRKDRLYE